MARAAAEARPVWVNAKAASDYALFLPALERDIELRLAYIDCFDDVEERYDILLDNFEPEMTSAQVRDIFDELKAELVPLIASLRDEQVYYSFVAGTFPLDRPTRRSNDHVLVV